MATRLEIVTGEKVVYSDEVDEVVLPGIAGELGVLPRHAPLLTELKPGELLVKKKGEEVLMAITGGFLEVMPDKVVILADAAERAEEIDLARAEAARKNAEETLKAPVPEADLVAAEASLRRALARIKVAQRRRRPGTGGAPSREG